MQIDAHQDTLKIKPPKDEYKGNIKNSQERNDSLHTRNPQLGILSKTHSNFSSETNMVMKKLDDIIKKNSKKKSQMKFYIWQNSSLKMK